MTDNKHKLAQIAGLLVWIVLLPVFAPACAGQDEPATPGQTETQTHFSLPASGSIETEPVSEKTVSAQEKPDQEKPAASGLFSGSSDKLTEPVQNKANSGKAGAAVTVQADSTFLQKTGQNDNNSQQQDKEGRKRTAALQPGAVSTAPATVLPAPSASEGQSVAQEHILPCGLKVLLLENHEFPVVSTLVWYRVGSRDEQTGATGLSHMVEHLMFQEVGQFKPGDIGSTIARVGGQFNGYTSDDFTTFFETLPSNKLEMALKIESDRMYQTRFSAAEVKQEIANINAEFENESKDPVALLSREVRATMFTRHPYHNPTIGKKSDVESLSAESARSFYEKYFHPANATLIISGDVYARQALPLVQKYFARSSGAKPVTHANIIEPPQTGERKVICKYSGNREVVQVAYRAPSMDSPDVPSLVIIERLLNGGVSGRLKSKLIDSKICSLAQASYDIKKEPGIFFITCTAAPGTANAQSRIVENLDSLIAQLRDKPLPEADVRRARNQAEFSYFAECDGPYRAGFHLGYFDSLAKWPDAYSWADRLRAVTAADLNRVARKYFAADTRVIGYISGTPANKVREPRSSNSEPTKERDRGGFNRPVEHVRLVGFKDSDTDVTPAEKKKKKGKGKTKDNSKKKDKGGIKDKDKDKGKGNKKDKGQTKGSKKQDNARTKEASPAPENSKTRQDGKPKQKKSGIPAVMRDIPSALGNAVTGNIPGVVGSVGSAIINLPQAIGDIGTVVGSTASVLGKQIVQLKSAPDSEHVSHHVLKNGIHIIVFQSHISPIVQICGFVQAGEAYSPRNKPGYSLLASCLLNQGSVDRNRQQMSACQDEIGINPAQMLKFESGLETIDFSTRCLARDLPAQLAVVAETLSKPDLLDDGTIDKAQSDALSILKRNEDTPAQKADRVLLTGLLDENSPFSPSDPSDRARTISQADLTQAQKFFAGHVVPGATTVIFCGNCNPQAVFTLAESAFADWDGKGSHAPLHAKARGQKVVRSTVPMKDSKKTSICFGQIMPLTQVHPEYGSLLVADSILANHPLFSRFEKALSKNPALENAIALGDMTVKLTPLSNLTCWSLSLTLDPAVVPLSIKTTRNELKQISGTGVTAQEFQEVKRYLLGSLPVRTQSTLGSIGNSLLESAKHSDTINGYAAEIASIKASTLESVNKVIRGVFKPGESALVIAGGAQSIKAGRNNAGAADEAEKPAADNPSGSKTLSAEGQAAPAKPDSVPAKMEENSASDGKVKQKG